MSDLGQSGATESVSTDLLDRIERALQKSYTAVLTLSSMEALNEPYRDDPRWTPYTRWLSPAAKAAHEARQALRAARFVDSMGGDA